MEKEKQKQMTKLPYLEKVDVMYQTYQKALYDCIGYISEIIKNSATFLSSDIPQYVQLLNMLNGQLTGVTAFLSDYKETEEVL